MNDIAQHFLETYARGGEVDGGWKFGKALRQSALDHSDASLARVDRLLASIRDRLKPAPADFIDDAGGRNFCALLAFYLMSVVQRRTLAAIDWHDLDSARAAMPRETPLPATPAARLIAIAPDPGSIHLPLAWIHDALFGHGARRPAASWVGDAIGQIERESRPADDGFAPTAEAPLDGAARDDMAYATGEPVHVGDAVLVDGGLLPARVALQPTLDDGRPGCVCEDAFGQRRVIAAAETADRLLLAARDTADAEAALAACVAWLDRRATHGSSDVLPETATPAQRALHGTAHARYALGNLHWQGICVPRNAGIGLRLFEAAADAAYAQAELTIARIHLDGDMVEVDAKKGLDYLQRAAARGHARALGRLGALHEAGRHLAADLGMAVTLYQRAIAGGDAAAMVNLARLLQEGRGVPADARQAVALLERAAAQDFASAQYRLGLCCDAGQGVAQDPARAARWYARAAAQGFGAAIHALADKQESGVGVARDLDKAVALYRQAADRNVVAAWYSLGRMAAEGRGMPRDLVEAARWMQRAAAHDFLQSRSLLADYLREQGASRFEDAERTLADAAALDPQALVDAAARLVAAAPPAQRRESRATAFKLLMQAARRGHAGAQCQVADAYRRGLGVDASPQLALDWLERAAVQDHAGAIRTLGEVYETGELGVRDATLAFGYSLRTARSAPGGAAAQAAYRVARMHADGRGTPANLAEALRWMETAADHGVADAEVRVESLRRALAADTVIGAAVSKKPGWKFW